MSRSLAHRDLLLAFSFLKNVVCKAFPSYLRIETIGTQPPRNGGAPPSVAYSGVRLGLVCFRDDTVALHKGSYSMSMPKPRPVAGLSPSARSGAEPSRAAPGRLQLAWVAAAAVQLKNPSCRPRRLQNSTSAKRSRRMRIRWLPDVLKPCDVQQNTPLYLCMHVHVPVACTGN